MSKYSKTWIFILHNLKQFKFEPNNFEFSNLKIIPIWIEWFENYSIM